MIRYLSLALTLLVLVSPAAAQSNRLTYTEEFGGSSLESGHIGALGWNVEGNADVNRLFFDFPNVHNAGIATVHLPFDKPPGWGSIVLGALLPEGRNTIIPFRIFNDTWQAQFTFGFSGGPPSEMKVGLFIPQPAPGGFTIEGCYVSAVGGSGNFQYVCRSSPTSGVSIVDSGLPVESSYYTLRMRRETATTVTMSLTKVLGANTAEDTSTLRSVATQGVFRDVYEVPAFQIRGSDAIMIADYFFFDLQNVRR